MWSAPSELIWMSRGDANNILFVDSKDQKTIDEKPIHEKLPQEDWTRTRATSRRWSWFFCKKRWNFDHWRCKTENGVSGPSKAIHYHDSHLKRGWPGSGKVLWKTKESLIQITFAKNMLNSWWHLEPQWYLCFDLSSYVFCQSQKTIDAHTRETAWFVQNGTRKKKNGLCVTVSSISEVWKDLR